MKMQIVIEDREDGTLHIESEVVDGVLPDDGGDVTPALIVTSFIGAHINDIVTAAPRWAMEVGRKAQVNAGADEAIQVRTPTLVLPS